MPDISKINALAIGSVSKVDGLAKASILDIDGLTIPSDFTGILDTYPNALAAHSFRRLNSAYTGACLRIRRSDTNAEQDIGFDANGYVDKAAIQAFVPSDRDGFITKWYGQESAGGTGSGNDAVQTITSAQSRIIQNNVFIEQGNFVILGGSSTAAHLAYDLETTLTNSSMDIFCAFYATGTALLYSSDPNDVLLVQQNGDTGNHTERMGTPTYYFNGSLFTGTTRAALYTEINGQRNIGSILNVDVNDAVRSRYGWYGSPSFIGVPSYNHHEIIIWADESDNRAAIETNLNDYYSIN